VNQAITLAIDSNHTDFPPAPGKIRELVARRAGQRQTCPRCVDTEGFLYVDKYSVRLCQHDA
jgi:hypothetical protein